MKVEIKVGKMICWLIGSLLLTAILTSASAIVDVNVLKSTVSGQENAIHEVRTDVKQILFLIGKCK